MSKRTKHKKQTTIALLEKRPKFSSLFIKKWLGILIISVLIYGVALMIFDNYIKTSAQNNFHYLMQSHLEAFSHAQSEGAPGPFVNQMAFRFARHAEAYGITSLLYDTTTKEILASCEEQIFLPKARTDDSPSLFYACPTGSLTGWSAHREKMNTYRNSTAIFSETVNISDFYTNGTVLLPTAFTIDVYSQMPVIASYVAESAQNPTNTPPELEDANHPKHLYTTGFDSPQNIPDGYEKLTVTEDYLNPLILGYDKNSPYIRNQNTHDSYEILQANYNSIKSGNSLPFSISLYQTGTPFELTLVTQNDLTLSTGQAVTLLSAYYLNIWDNYGIWLILVAVILFILGLFLALLLSYLSFTKLKAQYDIMDYRKTLMNTMAHDLKSPLMSISGYAENLKDNVHSEKREYYSEAILDNVQYMNHLIDSVLTLSKTEKNGVQLKKEPIDIKTFIQELLDKYDPLLAEASVTPVLTGTLTLSVDPVLFTQAMENLITNAIKYAAPDSTLEISLTKSEISFSNPCKEDLSEVIDTLCEPFITADPSRSNKKGSGLGLAIVKNICDFHGFLFKLHYKKNSQEEGIFRAVIILKKS